MNNFSFVLLSDRPDLKHQCCQLLGEEWKRSDAARLQGLSPNSKDLPDSVLLLDESEDNVKVVGHSRLSRVLEDNRGCWIASVIVSKKKRGQGLGKSLMLKTEDYAKVLGFTTAYLNTRDKQEFYEHLGYTYCSPVSPHKGSLSINGVGHLSSFHQQVLGIHEEVKMNQLKDSTSFKNLSASSLKTSTAAILPPPVPPPPPPPPTPPVKCSNLKSDYLTSATGQYWMKKCL